jgi:hypothetical protein
MSHVGKTLAPPIVGLGLLLAACHPSGAETISDLDVVATTHDATFDFATPTTYALPNKVFFISDTDPGGNPDRLPADVEQLILSTIENQMTALGYQKVDDAQAATGRTTTPAIRTTRRWSA